MSIGTETNDNDHGCGGGVFGDVDDNDDEGDDFKKTETTWARSMLKQILGQHLLNSIFNSSIFPVNFLMAKVNGRSYSIIETC